MAEATKPNQHPWTGRNVDPLWNFSPRCRGQPFFKTQYFGGCQVKGHIGCKRLERINHFDATKRLEIHLGNRCLRARNNA